MKLFTGGILLLACALSFPKYIATLQAQNQGNQGQSLPLPDTNKINTILTDTSYANECRLAAVFWHSLDSNNLAFNCYLEAAEQFAHAQQWIPYANMAHMAVTMYDATQPAEYLQLLILCDTIIENITQNLNEQQAQLLAVYVRKGISHRRLNQPQAALIAYEKAITLANILNIENNCTIDAYRNAAKAHSKNLAYKKSTVYLEKALRMAKKNKQNKAIVDVFCDLAPVYHFTNQYNKIEALYNEVKNLPDLSATQQAIIINNVLLFIYDQSQQYQKGKTAAQKAIQLLKKTQNDRTNYLLSRVYSSLASFEDKLGQLDAAISSTQTAIQYAKNTHNAQGRDLAMLYVDLGNFQLQIQNKKEALKNYHYALMAVVPTLTDSSWQAMPLAQNLPVDSWVMTALHLKGRAIASILPNDTAAQIQALTYYILSLKCAQALKTFGSEDDKITVSEHVYHVYEQAISTCLALFNETKQIKWQQQAFNLMEESRAFILRLALNDLQGKAFSQIPDELMQTEQNLRNLVAEAQQNIIEYPDSIALQDSLLRHQKQYEQMIAALESEYPAYYQIKHNTKTLSIADIQKSLVPKTAYLSYFLGDSALFIFALNKDTVIISQFFYPDNLNETILKFNAHFTNYAQHKTSKKAYQQLAYTLSKWLLQPVVPAIQGANFIIIAPDGVLGLLPFDVLPIIDPQQSTSTQNPEKNTQNNILLGQHAAISYAFSATVQFAQPPSHNTNLLTYGGYAPLYNSALLAADSLTKNLTDLPEARQTVANIAHRWKGDAFVAEQATKDQFLTTVANYRVVQVAGHSIINDSIANNSKLVFTQTQVNANNHFLDLSDMYALHLNADLVILSACNTGLGRVARGEGIMSLARAFSYAGSSSVAMSLWSVPSQATAIIMETFTKLLQDGMPKHLALQKAKQAYLQVAPPEHTHPYYWAGFIVIGNTDPLTVNAGWGNFKWWWVIIGSLLLGFGLVYMAARHKNKSGSSRLT